MAEPDPASTPARAVEPLEVTALPQRPCLAATPPAPVPAVAGGRPVTLVWRSEALDPERTHYRRVLGELEP